MRGHRNPFWGGWGRTSGRRIPPKTNKPVNSKKPSKNFFLCWVKQKSFHLSEYIRIHQNTSEYITNYIKKTFNRGENVVKALGTLVKTDPDYVNQHCRPVKRLTKQMKIERMNNSKRSTKWSYEALKRKWMYNDNLFKAFALILERCTKSMQSKLLALSNYEDPIHDNPIKPIKAIKEHTLNYKETRYEMSIILDDFKHCATKKSPRLYAAFQDIKRYSGIPHRRANNKVCQNGMLQ